MLDNDSLLFFDLLGAGIDLRARKEFLGHALDDVTDSYTAMNAESFKSASKLINTYLNGEKWKAENNPKEKRKNAQNNEKRVTKEVT